MAHCLTFDENGSKYCGESNSGTLHGRGMLVEPSQKGVFEGLWVQGSQISGVYTWPNNKQYMGDWKGPFRSGLGVETRPDGTKYSGEFSHNSMGPLGVLSLPTHGLYFGMWDATGVQEGDGVEAYADGGFYRGQYKGGQRDGYGTRSSAGYEMNKDVVVDAGGNTKPIRLHHRPSVAVLMEKNFTPSQLSHTLNRSERHTTLKRVEGGSSSTEDINKGVSWNQIYEGQWDNDKRCGHGILKVNDLFTYYGQWKENTRTGYGVLVYEGGKKSSKKGKNREEIREEGRWENGKLEEPVKYKNFKVVKSELKQRVEEAHQEAIKAATQARDRAVLAETKANAAAAKSKVAETRAAEARRHADGASSRVEQTAKISQQIIEDVCNIKAGVRITVNGKAYDDTMARLKPHSISEASSSSSNNAAMSYSYKKLAAENDFGSPYANMKGIPAVSSFHSIQDIKESREYR